MNQMRPDLATPEPWQGSLECSRARRAAVTAHVAARRATARARGLRGAALALMLGILVAAPGVGVASAVRGGGGSVAQASNVAGADLAAVQRRLGVPADGVLGPQTRRAVRDFQRRRGLVADGLIGPQTLRALGLSASRVRSGGGSVATQLEKIARCESGGNPAAVSPSGLYRGKYQFSRDTWRRVGGRGDPAKASEAEQDRRAAILLSQSGTAAWPSCA